MFCLPELTQLPEGLVTWDPPPISCSLLYPAKTERRHNIRGLPYPWGHCSSGIPCSPDRARWEYFWRCCLNQRDDCKTKVPLLSNQQKLSLLFHLDSEHVCTSVDVLPSKSSICWWPESCSSLTSLTHLGRECGAVHERVTIHNRPVRVQFVDRKWVRFSCHQVHTSL